MAERRHKGKDLVYVRSLEALPKPAKRAIIPVDPISRFRMHVDIRLWLRIENTLHDILHTEIVAWAVAFGVSLAAVVATIEFWSARRAVTLSAYILAGMFTIIGTVIVKQCVDAVTRRIRESYAHRGDRRRGSHSLSLTFSQAEKVTQKAQEILTGCMPSTILGRVVSINSDRDNPYRILRGFLPIGPFFFRRPRFYRRRELSEGEYIRYRFGIDIADALCAGLLGACGARPRLRYSEDTDIPLAQDRFWRNDIQELPDTGSGDIFLRYHQSTVEGDFPPTATSVDVCTLKTYACIGNFRETPLFLLRVKDVVDCLLARSELMTQESQEAIYADLSIDKDHAFRLLKSGLFAKQSARADRFRYESTADPIGKPILATGDDDQDFIMSFDAGRVWPRADAGVESKHAVIALRRAIHLASRCATIEVKLTRQDVIIIDNLRMMVCRREDAPTGLGTPVALIRDIAAAAAPNIAGRWFRQIYGFQPKVSSRPVAAQTNATAAETLIPANPGDVGFGPDSTECDQSAAISPSAEGTFGAITRF